MASVLATSTRFRRHQRRMELAGVYHLHSVRLYTWEREVFTFTRKSVIACMNARIERLGQEVRHA